MTQVSQTMPAWTALRIVSSDSWDAVTRDAVIAALFENGSQGIHEDGNAIVTHFPPGTDVDAVSAAVRHVDADVVITQAETPTVDWSEWRARVTAHQVGNFVVAPPWEADRHDPVTTIVIDPAMAFGTGEHPTTRGVLRLMQSVIRPDDVVADLGAGSAVLSIAAVKLGASRVAAIELDSDAAGNAAENIERNNVTGHVQFIEGDAAVLLPLVAPVRVVLANIVSSVLVPMLPVIASSLTNDGDVILSGLLQEEREVLMPELQRGGWSVVAEDVEDVWWSIHLRR